MSMFVYYQPSHEMKCESMAITFYIPYVVKDLKTLEADVLAHVSFVYVMI